MFGLMIMAILLQLVLVVVNTQKIYSLEENFICEIKPCEEEIQQYYYGQETFGDLTGVPFMLTCIQKNNKNFQKFFITQKDREGVNPIVTLFQSTSYSFTIYNTDTKISQQFNQNVWYQIIITEQIIQVCNHLECFSTPHNQTITQNTKLNILNSPSTEFNFIQACCIVMYKGVTYPNTNQITFQNTKFPEVVVNLNIQEKVQSNITVDYSDYQYIAKLGEFFEYDQYDPYLIDDSLLFNGSQYIQINQITLNAQLSFEFRFKQSDSFTSDITLLNYTFPSTNSQIYIFLNGSKITYKLNNQSIQFQLLTSDYTHFCLGIIQFMEQSANLQQLYFIQFSDTETLQILTQNITGFFIVNHAFGYLNIGSKKNQFQSGESFNLFIFRYYQGFFYDDQQVMSINCNIYLNDRCIICNIGYILKDDNSCILSCDSTNYDTILVPSHSQCIRKCHQKCATCSFSDPNICLTCNSIRNSPPDCKCPSQYFEDYVSPKCRKYYPDVSVQTGNVVGQCGVVIGDYHSEITVYYEQTYKTTPKVIVSLVGQSFNFTDINYLQWYIISSITSEYFKIKFFCDVSFQIYIFNWISSIGNNLLSSPKFQQLFTSNMNFTLTQSVIIYNASTINPIYQTNGLQFDSANTKFQIKQQVISPTLIRILSNIRNFNYFQYFNHFYTLFKTYNISSSSLDTQLDDQPKSVRHFIVQRGFYVDSIDKYRYVSNTRTSTYLKIKQQYNQSMEIYDWLLILASQQCKNITGPCDFYDSYISNCDLQFQFCAKCSYYCQECEEETKCLTCPYSRQLNEFNICVCSRGFYNKDNQQICESCPNNCESCLNFDQCLECKINYTLSDGQCFCPEGFYEESGLCLSCDSQFGKFQKQCNYKNCYDNIWTPSEQCDDGNKINNDGCTNCTIDKNYQCLNRMKQKSICYQCQNNCQSCTYNKKSVTCNLCIEGYYLYNNQCLKCDKYCKTCASFSRCTTCIFEDKQPDEFQRCARCDLGFYEQNEECVPQCGDGIKTNDEQCDDGNTSSSDGCSKLCLIEDSYVCNLYQNKSSCFLSDKPKLKINKIIKLTQSQYVINLISTQEINYQKLDVSLFLKYDNSYNFSYEVNSTRNESKYSILQMNITINFTVSLQKDIFIIKINGNIQNRNDQATQKNQLEQEFSNIYILSEVQQSASQQGSDIANKLFYLTVSLTVLQLILSGSQSVSLMLRTQNYLQYMRFIKIDFPPNVAMLFSQFADSNILRYLDFNYILNGLFGVGFDFNTQIINNKVYELNNNKVNTSFILNIMPFILTFVQSYLIIKLTQLVVYLINHIILYRHKGQQSYLMKIYKVLSIGQFYALKQINSYKKSGIKEIILISQYSISFALFIKLKTFDYNSYYDCAEMIFALAVSYICFNYSIDYKRNQQGRITLLRLINGVLYTLCIVFLDNLQLGQILLISIQSIMMLIILFQKNILQNLLSVIEEFSFLLTYLSSILYIYCPIEVNQIWIGFFQFGAILLSISYNMLSQLGVLFQSFMNYYYGNKVKKQQYTDLNILKI